MRLSYYLTLLFFVVPSPDYPTIFGEDYTYATRFLGEHKARFVATCPTGRAREGMAVVFPELIRYNLLRDLLETQALELFYVDEGSAAVDFSIGHFQMKPSFVEQLEAYVRQHPDLSSSQDIAAYPAESSPQAQRRIRLSRLQEMAWQVRYLAAFQEVCAHRFPFLNSLSAERRIHFLAAAYNCGFTHTADYIRQSANKKLFPYGINYRGEQYSYAAIAVYFFQNHLSTLLSPKP